MNCNKKHEKTLTVSAPTAGSYYLCAQEAIRHHHSQRPALRWPGRRAIQRGYCLVYIDDIIIFSSDLKSHSVQLDSVLSTLKKHNLFCQLPKCVWAQNQIKYLGHIVSGLGVLPDSDKTSVLDKWDIPPSVYLTESEEISVQ